VLWIACLRPALTRLYNKRCGYFGGQPNAVFRLSEDKALLMHLQSRDVQHDGFAITLADSFGGFFIDR